MAFDFFGNKSKSSKSSKSTSKSSKSSSNKNVKSKEQQKKELLAFAKSTVKKGKEVTKKASKGKSSVAKRFIGFVAAIVVIAVLACGVMYYFDVAPFDVVYSDALEFKYYTFDEVDTNLSADYSNVSGELVIHFIDVGQGDCIFIQFPDGKTMLIDGGENRTALKESIPEYLFAVMGTSTVQIDYLMLTHCDSDHCGSLGAIIANDNINVKSVYQPRVISKYENDVLQSYVDENPNEFENLPKITTGVYATFAEAVYNECEDGICTNVVYNFEGQSISGTDWYINIYNPNEDLYAALAKKSPSAQDKNNISPIMVLSFAGTDILLTGDADEEAEINFAENIEEDIFNDDFDGDVDILKVAHHGGKYSTLDAFLAIVEPEYAVISVGPEPNKHGHPTQETLDRLSGISCTIYQTRNDGNVVLTVTAAGYTFDCSEDSQANSSGFFGIVTLSYYSGFCRV